MDTHPPKNGSSYESSLTKQLLHIKCGHDFVVGVSGERNMQAIATLTQCKQGWFM